MSEHSRIVKERLEKIDALREEGRVLYGGRFDISGTIKELLDGYEEGKKVTAAGRLMALRAHGKSIFGDLRDSSGKIQIYIKIDAVGEDDFNFFKKLDIGDIVGFEGELLKTRTGEVTIKTERFELLSKIVQTLPEKWHGLKDVETRYRHRYMDLISNQESRDVLMKRSKIISYVRRFLDQKGFLEVETPILQQMEVQIG